MTPIEKDIYKVLAYFSFFKYPLTAFEIWKWQYKPEDIYSLAEIKKTLLESRFLQNRVFDFEGMYALGADIELQVLGRKQKYLNAVEKEQKLKKVLSYLVRLSDIQGVALCNNMPFHFTDEHSDIDFFVIAKSGRVWSARLSAVLPLILLKQRPGELLKNPVDISFLLSEDKLNLNKLKIGEEDPYLSFWIKTLIPVYGVKDIWNKFFEANSWTNNILPNVDRPQRSFQVRIKNKIKFLRLPFSEKWVRIIQKNHFPQDIKDTMNQNTNIVVSDDILKFHKNDRREEILKHFLDRLCEIG